MNAGFLNEYESEVGKFLLVAIRSIVTHPWVKPHATLISGDRSSTLKRH